MVDLDALADAVQAAQPTLAMAVPLLGMLAALRRKEVGSRGRHTA